MKTPPYEDVEALIGLVTALILSLDKRGALGKAEFIADLDAVIAQATKDKSLAPSTLSAVSRLQAWLRDLPSLRASP